MRESEGLNIFTDAQNQYAFDAHIDSLQSFPHELAISLARLLLTPFNP
jgi:hypothetical protein